MLDDAVSVDRFDNFLQVTRDKEKAIIELKKQISFLKSMIQNLNNKAFFYSSKISDFSEMSARFEAQIAKEDDNIALLKQELQRKKVIAMNQWQKKEVAFKVHCDLENQCKDLKARNAIICDQIDSLNAKNISIAACEDKTIQTGWMRKTQESQTNWLEVDEALTTNVPEVCFF